MERARGDIYKAYAPTVDPDQATTARRMGILKAEAKHTPGGGARPPFCERWTQLGAPDRGTLLSVVQPGVVDRLPEPEVAAPAAHDAEVPPHLLLPTGTDLDDARLERVQRALAMLCAAHLSPAGSGAQSLGGSGGGCSGGGGGGGGGGGDTDERLQAALAGSLPALGVPSDAATHAKREELIDRLIKLAYSSHASDAKDTLPVPLRGARSGIEVLYERSAKGGSHAAARPGARPVAGASDPPEAHLATSGLHRASGRGLLAHVGRAIARSADPTAARAAREKQAAAARDAAAAAVAAAEAAVARAAASQAEEEVAAGSAWAANAPGDAPKVLAEPVEAEARARLQAVLLAVQAPMEVSVGLAIKYTRSGQREALAAALPLWEEAAAAIGAQRNGKGDEAALAAAEERCLAAARALAEQCGDVASFAGKPFTELFAPD